MIVETDLRMPLGALTDSRAATLSSPVSFALASDSTVYVELVAEEMVCNRHVTNVSFHMKVLVSGVNIDSFREQPHSSLGSTKQTRGS